MAGDLRPAQLCIGRIDTAQRVLRARRALFCRDLNGYGSKLNHHETAGFGQVLVHVSTYQGSILGTDF